MHSLIGTSAASSRGNLFDINTGQFTGVGIVQKFGRNADVGTTEEDIWSVGGKINWLQAATAVRIAAGGDANDTAAGTGAREITVVGLDENWLEVTETIATAGASASSATTTTFIRVNRIYVSQSGTYTGANAAAIVLENGAGGTTLGEVSFIAAGSVNGLGQSQFGAYSVPDAKNAFLTIARVFVDGTKRADVRLFTRDRADDVAAPFSSPRMMQEFPGLAGDESHEFDTWIQIPERSDIWFSAVATASGTPIDVSFDLILVDDA